MQRLDDRGVEDFFLAAEVAVQHRLVDPGLLRDHLGRRGAEITGPLEHPAGRAEDAGPPSGRIQPLPPDLRVFREAFVFVAVALVLLFRPQGLIPARGLKERI